MSLQVEFVSKVPARQRLMLESLVFFNRCQGRVIEGIVDAIENFGTPEIFSDGEYLRVRLSGLPGSQAIFAVDAERSEPLALAVFVRSDLEHVTVVHVGVREDFAAGGIRANEHLLLKLLKEIRRSSLRLKGVRHVDLHYGTTRTGTRSSAAAARRIS
jgi:hypothetical protein